jgi:1-acyl-sn-glycerol-3-phosphate acyltransferase
MMDAVRSLTFNAAFYVSTFVWVLAILPTLLLPQERFAGVVRAYIRSTLWLLRVIAGIRVEFRGLERITEGPLLVAAKHQSTLETFALLLIFDRPAFILKRELTRIPLFGWYLTRLGNISVDRAAGAAALRTMMGEAKAAIGQGRQIIIFPEGTRRPPGAPADYKPGIVQMYRGLGVPCLPVALNTGVFWPRRRLAMRPGVAVIEILPPLPAELPRADMLPALIAAIEPASERLLAEAGDAGAPGVPQRERA